MDKQNCKSTCHYNCCGPIWQDPVAEKHVISTLKHPISGKIFLPNFFINFLFY